ncbi:AMP-binding protein, partial [Virgibacillus salarius]|uniref:AMP-binding protein n=1 Tax=Virgibacillus salarius TaxID=447199 RepID=UPI0031D8371F
KTYPMKRIEYMLKDSNAQLVLTDNDAEKLGAFSGERLDITNESLYVGNTSNLSIEHHPTNLAYIMYSSGSTGEPKGILIEQRNVVRLVKHTSYIQFNEGDRILQTGSLVFDASTFEIWGSLLNGQSLYLTKKETILSVEKLENAIEKHSITLMWLTVALFNQLAQEKPDMFRHLRCLLVGGDVLSTKHIQLVRSHCSNIQIINGYGPTENTTFSTTLPI